MQSVSPALVLLAGLACVGCGDGAGTGGSPGPKAVIGDPIARIGKTKLTVEEIQRRIDEQSPFVRARYADDAKKKEFLDSQVKFEVLAQEAFARGLDQDPDVQDSIKKVIVQKLTRMEFDGRVKAGDITDDEMKAYFEAHRGEYDKPEQARASVIVVAFGADKAAAKKTIDQAHAKVSDKSKLEDRTLFRDQVAQVSTDEDSRRAGGDVRYLSRADVAQQFGDEASGWLFDSETIHEVSPVLEHKDRFVVLKRTGKRKAITRTFDQVKNQIKNVVFREKRQQAFDAFVDEMKAKHGVQVFEEKLAKVKVSAEVPQPPAGHGADDGHGHGMPAHPPDLDAPVENDGDAQ